MEVQPVSCGVDIQWMHDIHSVPQFLCPEAAGEIPFVFLAMVPVLEYAVIGLTLCAAPSPKFKTLS